MGNAFRAGAFNVLVATDVAARGIDIQDVDLVVQYEPPRDVDTYVHRSGRTGRAEKNGTSVVLFDYRQQRDIVRIERELGHGFKFELSGPPSVQAALNAAAKPSAVACKGVPDETAAFFKESAEELLKDGSDPVDIVSRCLAAISRRSAEVQTRSLLTGESGFATVEMTNDGKKSVSSGDVMFTVSKLARESRKTAEENQWFESDVGKIQINFDTGSAMFDMTVDDAKKLVEYSGNIDTGGAVFKILEEIGISRGRNFGMSNNRGGGRGGGSRYGGGGGNRYGGGGGGRYSKGGQGGGGGRYGGGGGGRSGPYNRGGGDRRRGDSGGSHFDSRGSGGNYKRRDRNDGW